jgi:hypothetical protein
MSFTTRNKEDVWTTHSLLNTQLSICQKSFTLYIPDEGITRAEELHHEPLSLCISCTQLKP